MKLSRLTRSELTAFNAWLDEIVDTPFGQFDRGEFFLFSTGCRGRDRGLSWLKAAFKAGLDHSGGRGFCTNQYIQSEQTDGTNS